jgi:hypothetical protein
MTKKIKLWLSDTRVFVLRPRYLGMTFVSVLLFFFLRALDVRTWAVDLLLFAILVHLLFVSWFLSFGRRDKTANKQDGDP